MKEVSLWNLYLSKDKVTQIDGDLSYRVIDNSDLIIKAVMDIFEYDKQPFEIVGLLVLNEDFQVVGLHQISEGGIEYANLDTRKIIVKTLLNNGTYVVLFHNHICEVIEHSVDDFIETVKVADKLRMFGIYLIDHIVVGGKDYQSLADNNGGFQNEDYSKTQKEIEFNLI